MAQLDGLVGWLVGLVAMATDRSSYESLDRNGCTGRLRVAREGLNGTLTGSHKGIRAFTAELAAWCPAHFGQTDFKCVT